MIDKKSKIIYLLMAFVAACIAWRYAHIISVQRHEFADLGMALPRFSFAGMIKNVIAEDRCPALSHIITFCMLKVLPMKITYMRVPSVMAAAVAVFFAGLLGHKVRGLRTGIVTAALMITFTCGCAYGVDMRLYSLLTMFGTVAAYVYTCRLLNLEGETIGRRLLQGVVYGLLVNTHYTGVIMVAAFFLVDVYLMIKKRDDWRSMIPYGVCFVLFLPWMIYGIIAPMLSDSSFLVSASEGVGKSKTVFKLMKEPWLSTKLKCIFAAGLLAAFLFYLKGIFGKTFDGGRKFLWNGILFICAFVFVFVAVYTMQPNGNLGVRFFIPIYAYIFLFMAAAFDKIICGLFKKETLRYIFVVLACLFLFAGILPRVNFLSRYDRFDFVSSAEYLLDQEDIRDSDVIVYRPHLAMGCNSATLAWYQYCMGGGRSGIRLSYEADEKNLDGINKVYVVHSEHQAPLNFYDEYTKETLEKDFVLKDRIPLRVDPENNEIRIYVRKRS
ncbi:MAG: glycosyltransferase family 39 protein [Abditibacteriota bacterium]|nr:glycosyltransferase family 39 protein [Abditibacteriota bacterium]